MTILLVKDLSVPRDRSPKGSAKSSTSVGALSARQQPSEGIPKGGTHVLALCATPGQLDYFIALALQQHGEQSALRKGRG
jgi:hypothetical protein